MAQAPKSLEGAQKPHNIDIVSVSSDELEIVGTGTRSAYNADSQANDSTTRPWFAAVRPAGRSWLFFWVLMDICALGHAPQLQAVVQRDVLLAVL